MGETAETRALDALLRRCNALVKANVGNAMQGGGWPDRYVVHKYWRGWIEFKIGTRGCSSSQRMKIRELNRLGDVAVVLRFVDNTLVLEDCDGNSQGEWGTPGSPAEAVDMLQWLSRMTAKVDEKQDLLGMHGKFPGAKQDVVS